MTHCSSWLMAWLIYSYLLPWSLQMFAHHPLVPAGHFTQLYLVSFHLNLFCPLFLSCFLFGGCFCFTQYLSRAKGCYNTHLLHQLMGTVPCILTSLPCRSFFQAADRSSGHRIVGQRAATFFPQLK